MDGWKRACQALLCVLRFLGFGFFFFFFGGTEVCFELARQALATGRDFWNPESLNEF
jgi:hypothetical protein